MAEKKKKFKLPSSYALIIAIIIIVAILSWIIPGGAYEYVDPNASKLQPIPGTYHRVESNPQGLGDIALAPVNGFIDAIDIILYTLVIGGFLAIVMKTGAIDAGIGHILKKLKGRERLMIPILMLVFSIAGAAFGIEEETLPFFLIIIPIFIAAGYDALVGLSVVKLGAALGVMASIANPFAVAIASRFAGISIGDGIGTRLLLLAIYIPSGIIFTMRYAERVHKDPHRSLVYEQRDEHREFFLKSGDNKADKLPEFTRKRKLVLLVFALSFILMLWGVLPWSDLGITVIPTMNWWFEELSAIFLVASIIVGIIAGYSEDDLINTFIDGAKDLLDVAMIIGLSRGVSVIMNDAKITDTILHAGENLLSNTSSSLFAVVVYLVYLVLSIFVPSSSGLATLSMGIMAPLADFAGVAREIVVIAYAAANSMVSLVSPTVGILMGVLTMTKVSYGTWIKFVGKFLLYIAIVTMVLLAIAARLLSI